MSKLTKFLDTRSEFLSESESGSIYYRIGNKKIRIANHLTINASQFALTILTPVNTSTQYIVCINNTVYIYNTFTELKPFLINWCLITQNSANVALCDTKIDDSKALIKKLEREIERLNRKEPYEITNINLESFTIGQRTQIKNFMRVQKIGVKK